MKVTGVKTTIYQSDLTRKKGDANSPGGRVSAGGMVIELTTDEGLTGISIGGASERSTIHSFVDEVVVGKDPRGVRGIWFDMVSKAFKKGHDGIVGDAISQIDIALWDLKAKANNEPLWKTLGGSTPKALAYASGIEMPLNDEELGHWYNSMADLGFKGGKLKVGLDQDADIRRVGIMNDALKRNTDRPSLLIDANEYWSPKQAIRYVSEIEEQFDITWVEEPARRWDFRGLRRIKDSVKAAVCIGENLDTLGDFLPYFHQGSADIVQVSSGMTGITGALQLADAAYGFELPVTLGGSTGNFHAHIAPSLPNHMMMEVTDVEPDPVFTSNVRVVDGWMIPGDEPGNGIEIVPDALAAHAVENLPRTSQASPLGRRRGAGLFPVPPTAEENERAAGLKYTPAPPASELASS
ncbi:MAG: mandelate racemase/muconate lactonizing enzyme family protein [Chloroflexi bacterium]|nr:mandelate racemase/muconate lactonizing enzyme family protein [Chloroflexota bacterium]